MAFVYKITNPKGRVYVGSTLNVVRRWAAYRSMHAMVKSQIRLFNSLKKYGPDAHIFEIITECTPAEMRSIEAVYGHMYDVMGTNGLNCALPKHGEFYKTISDETRAKMRIAAQKRPPARKGTKLSEEHKRKVSEGRKRFVFSKELKDRISRNSSDSKPVVNLETGIFYDSVEHAATTITHYTPGHLRRMVHGTRKNKTSFIYI